MAERTLIVTSFFLDRHDRAACKVGLGTETLRKIPEKPRRIAPVVLDVRFFQRRDKPTHTHTGEFEVLSNRTEHLDRDRSTSFRLVDSLQLIFGRSVNLRRVFPIINFYEEGMSVATGAETIGFDLIVRAFRSLLFCSIPFLMMIS
jgi:hypothetical protein